MPISSSRSCSSRGIIAVARSSVLPVWRVQKPGIATRRRRRLFDAQHRRVARRRHRGKKAVGGLVAADLAHLLAKDGVILAPVTVAIDDRVVQLGANIRRACDEHDRSWFLRGLQNQGAEFLGFIDGRPGPKHVATKLAPAAGLTGDPFRLCGQAWRASCCRLAAVAKVRRTD